MRLDLVKKGFNYAQKRRNWVLLLGALVGLYGVCNLPSVARKRRKLSKLLGALISIAEVVPDSAEAIGIVTKDLNEFLQTDSDQIPNSPRQVSKITVSVEFSESAIRITRALTVGIMRVYLLEAQNNDDTSAISSFPDRFLDKLFSPAGSCFASVVVGSLAKELVMALYSDRNSSESENLHYSTSESSSVPELVNVMCGKKFRELIGECVRLFVSTAVSVYLDKTMHINTYDEIFSGLTNPNHESKMKDMLTSICNGAIETFESGWVNKISSTLAVPSNRKLFLDVTGTVTFETVRSFLEFLLEKLSEVMRNLLDFALGAVIDMCLGIYRYLTVKSSAMGTLCISLYLHTLQSTWRPEY
ncbi:hypothetical protein NMG60_11006004 [Bertholletia excelsa]